VKIDNEFKKYIRPLSEHEYKKLKTSILAEGIRDSLVCWNSILIDGYHRYQIAQENNIEYRVTEIELENREAAKEWMITNQLGRRNLTPGEASYYRGKLYESRKQHQYIHTKSVDQNDTRSTASKIADEYGVSEPTVKRDAVFSKAIDNVTEFIGEGMRDSILSGKAKVSKVDVEKLIDIQQKAPEMIERISSGEISIPEAKKEVRKRERDLGKIEKEIIIENDIYNAVTGDVWILGNHKLICGDYYVVGEKTLNNICVDACITDPPYGIDYNPNWKKWDGSESEFNKIHGDDEKFNPSVFFFYDTVVLFGAAYFSDVLPIGGWICWDKRLDAIKDNMIGSPFELAWFKSASTTRKSIMIRVLHGGVVNADSAYGNNEKRVHPTQKPIEVMRQIILAVTQENDVVLDPFIGSGSTLLACERVNRKCIGFEIEPEYVNMILARWKSMTGVDPVKEEK